jgi:ribonuclease PH
MNNKLENCTEVFILSNQQLNDEHSSAVMNYKQSFTTYVRVGTTQVFSSFDTAPRIQKSSVQLKTGVVECNVYFSNVLSNKELLFKSDQERHQREEELARALQQTLSACILLEKFQKHCLTFSSIIWHSSGHDLTALLRSASDLLDLAQIDRVSDITSFSTTTNPFKQSESKGTLDSGLTQMVSYLPQLNKLCNIQCMGKCSREEVLTLFQRLEQTTSSSTSGQQR